jgi:type IV pilus assembly protein PilE
MLNQALPDVNPTPARLNQARRVARLEYGVTLIELMIVLVVVSILLGIAYPGYQQFVQKARRSEAQIGLTQTAAALEKYFTACSTYSLNLDPPNLQPTAANCATSATASTRMSDDNNYTLSAAAGPSGTIASDFILTATASTTGKQQNDSKCATLTLSSTGLKSSSPSTTECWKK